jgi:hypothetical protein
MTEVVDYRTPDLPSFMTLRELQTLMVFATKFALEEDALGATANVEIGILVRDRGESDTGGVKASWVEFSVAGREYAFWRHTMDLYEVKDGKVEGDPIHRND